MQKTIGQCLEFYRNELNWDQTAAAGATGFEVSQQQIGKIERGITKSPGYLIITMLLEAYGKTTTDLEKDRSDGVQLVKDQTNFFTSDSLIPVISAQDIIDFLAGVDVDVIDHIAVKDSSNKKMYAIKMANELMMSSEGVTYPQSSIVVFDGAKAYKEHKDMMVSTEEGILFRRVFMDGKTYYLKTLNPNHPNSGSTSTIKSLGRAIECRISVK